MRDYILRVLVALDRLINVIIGGKLEETLSASAWYGEAQGKAIPKITRPLIDLLFLPFEREHCYKQYLYERETFTHYPKVTNAGNH